MKILVTGSNGTLGRILTQELRTRGHDVYGCDLAHSEDVKCKRADVSDARQLDRVFDHVGKVDLVYHLAAEFGRNNGQEYYEQLWRSNVIGTRNVIEACLAHGSRLVFASSSEAYGDNVRYETNDGATLALSESLLDEYTPMFYNEYALSKWTNERQIFLAARNENLNAVVLRFFNAYGPGEYYTPYRSVVCLFAYRLMFGLPITIYKNYHRVFMWVGDWARTVANVADSFDKLPRTNVMYGSRPGSVPVYNVGGTEYRDIETMAKVVLDNLPQSIHSSAKINYVDKETANITNKKPDVSLAIRDLGHAPAVTLEQGIPATIDWMRTIYTTTGKLQQHAIAIQGMRLAEV